MIKQQLNLHKNASKTKLLLNTCTIIIFLLTFQVGHSIASTCDYDPDVLDLNTVRHYVKDTYTITKGSDELINSLLNQSPSWSSKPYLEIFKILIRLDEASCELHNGHYHEAISVAARYGLHEMLSGTGLGDIFLSINSLAKLAVLPIEYSLTAFQEAAIQAAWDNQIKLYKMARSLGYSHQAIINHQGGRFSTFY